MIVAKFGGTSVADADSITRAAEIVRTRLPRKPVVVVSALGGVTNGLLAIAEQAGKGHLIGALSGVQGLRDRHLETVETLLRASPRANDIASEVGATFDELASLAEALSVLGHATPRSLDAIAAMGEQLSSMIVAAAFSELGIATELIDARRVMITDESYTKAEPQIDAIATAVREIIRPALRKNRVPLLGGFIGATRGGVTTTLGRGGSDYSASLIGAALKADAIEIWTDVDGMLTADPRIVPDARLIERIRFDEASELASFGAKVLHPSTIAPAVQLGIPVHIFNSRRPEGTGTLIAADAPRRPVSAIAGKKGIATVKVRSPRMLLAHGFLRRVFDVFETHRTSIDVVATSEISISVTVDEGPHLQGLLVDLAALGDVSIERNRAILALVGGGLADDSQSMARALTALNGAKVHMLSLSATGINVTMIVDDSELDDAMRRIHAAFFG